MKKLIYLILICVLPFLSSCRKFFGIEGNHNLTSESRYESGFSEIKSSSDINVYIEQDSAFDIVVEAEENLLPYIETKLDHSCLEIEIKHGRNLINHYPINVFVKGPYFSEISLSGSGNIICDTLDYNNIYFKLSGSGDISAVAYCDKTEVKISGSGKVTLSGQASQTDYKISGSGKIKAFGMETGDAFCNISGSGDIYVFVNDLLDVNISGSGTVYYRGTPQVVVTISGSGKVIHD